MSLDVRVGDWVRWQRRPGDRQRVDIVTGLDAQDGCYIECGVFINAVYILEVRHKPKEQP